MSQKLGIFCSSDSFGGLELNLYRLAHWLHDRGTNLVVFAKEGSGLAQRCQQAGLAWVPVNKHRKYFDFRNAARVAKKLEAEGVDVLLVSATRDISLATIIKSWFYKEVKLIYQQQMQFNFSKKDLIHTLRYNQLDAWIAPLQILKHQVLKYTNVKEAQIHVIPLGVDVSQLTSHLVSRQEARTALNLPQDVRMLGILGRIDPKKGQVFAVEGLSELVSRKGVNMHLLIVGEPTLNEGDEYYQKLLDTIKDLGLEDRVHLRGFMSEVHLFFSAIDLFLMASEGETYGMVTLEAMACGVPVIGTNSGGTPELLGHGKFGRLYTPNKLPEFISAVEEIFADEHTAHEAGQAAAAEVPARYSHELECQQIEQLIAHLRAEK